MQVIYKGIEGSGLRNKILNRMVDGKVNLFRIAETAVADRLKSGEDRTDIVKFLGQNGVRWSYYPIEARFAEFHLRNGSPKKHRRLRRK
ncbi:DEKNAAC101282 [Brettanomyces naardenensis]|uniref:DEKNAAC101282 n=1 Tax=Brettanomyces naardenensis TaxID=13370 RepID=A0A448YHS0_BRENA|nr:DEKNAAC101282 [Brettanomyces naardenensis]